MNKLKEYWSNFKAQPDIWFFYGFLITFTLSVRKVLWTYPIKGQFNEYSGIYLYLSDIFLIGIIISWGVSILYNKQSLLSIVKSKNVPYRTILLPLVLVIWSFVSIIWSNNQIIAIFKSIKFLELYFVFIYIIIRIVPPAYRTGRYEILLRYLFKIIIAMGVIQSIIGVWQFIIQKSVGLFWLKESIISPEILGVAKIILDKEKYIRAYGLFPHPNILGGFLLLSIIFTLAYQKMFHLPTGQAGVEHFDNPESSSGVKNCSTWNNFDCKIQFLFKIVPRGTFILLIIQIIALILTFSKSAIIGLIIALVYVYWNQYVPPAYRTGRRGTFRLPTVYKMFHLPTGQAGVEHLCHKVIIMVGIAIIISFILRLDINSLLFKSLEERFLYQNVSRGTILDNPIIGTGAGQFVLTMQNFVPRGTLLELWQFQPVHNVFILIWSELGVIGLGLFTVWLWKLFHVEQFDAQKTKKCSTCLPDRQAWNIIVFRSILLGYIFIMLFDHYFWDIQQGQIMLWLTLGLLAGLNSYIIDKN